MTPVPTRRLVALLAGATSLIVGGFWLPLLVPIGGAVDLLIVLSALVQVIELGRSGNPTVTILAPSSVSIAQEFAVTVEILCRGRRPADVEIRLSEPASWRLDMAPASARCSPGHPEPFEFSFRALRRGHFDVSTVHIRASMPASLISVIRKVPVQFAVDVLPDVQGLNETLSLLQRDRLNHLGVHTSRLAGTGTEVAGLREYLPDDDAKRIDWKVSTRIQSPVVRTYQHESGGLCTILVDCGRHMSGEEREISALDHAVNSMLILSAVMAKTGDQLQVVGFHQEVVQHMPPARGRTLAGRVAKFSSTLQTSFVESNYRLACEYALRISRRSSLIMLFTDLMDGTRAEELIEWFARLRVRHTPVLVMLRDQELYVEANRALDDVEYEYLSAAARETVLERSKAIAAIRSHQIPVIDVLPSELTPPLIETYVRSRSRQSLRAVRGTRAVVA